MATAIQQNLAFMRITVLGLGNSGKTALINAFVNAHCPQVYQETQDPVLYYKLLRLANEDDDDTSAAGKIGFQALLEIEDTYSSFRADGKSFGVPRDIKNYLDMSRREPGEKSGFGKVAVSRPFEAFPAPKCDA